MTFNDILGFQDSGRQFDYDVRLKEQSCDSPGNDSMRGFERDSLSI